jgi:hypothetical protein
MSNAQKISRYIVTSPGDRTFEAVNDLLIILSALGYAASQMVDGPVGKTEQPIMRVGTRWPDYGFDLPLGGCLEHALLEKVPSEIHIGEITDSSEFSNPIPVPTHQTSGLRTVMAHIISPIFLMFFERYNDWLTANLGDAKNWPPTLNFARVVRNSIAHGKINIRDPNAQPVHWRGLSYGYKDSGRSLVGSDISLGEIIALIFDADDALDSINAPIL